jgi:SAM-dependent methyltransferase
MSIRLVDVACPRCGSSASHRIITGRDRLHHLPGSYYVSACAKCGLWFQAPRPDTSSIPELYPSDYAPHQGAVSPALTAGELWALRHCLGYAHLREPAPKPSTFRRWFGRWRADDELRPRFVDDGLLVEIGSASGSRLAAFRELGWRRAEGIEISETAALQARSRGEKVHTAAVEEGIELYADGSIDTIVTSMVVEHLVNPFAVMRRFAAKLKSGGELLFSTVVRDRIDARIWKTYWRSLDLPRHMVWFQKKDLDELLAPSFRSVRFHYQAEPIDFTGSARYRAEEHKHLFDSLLIRAGDRALKYPVIALSLAGQTSRVVVRAVRR